MFHIDEKLATFLMLSDEDKENLLDAKLMEVLQSNRDAVIRYATLCGGFFCAVMLFLMIFSSSGYAAQPVVLLIFALFLAALFFVFGKQVVLSATRRKGVIYPLLVTFACSFLYLFPDVLSRGGFFAFLVIFGAIGGVGFLGYRQYKADAEKWTTLQMATAGLAVLTFAFGLVYVGETMMSESTRSAIEHSRNEKRVRDAQEMRRNMMSCTTPEECNRMKKNKNAYYDAYAVEAHSVCEYAVANKVPSRFEWTQPAGTEKFQTYSLDTMKDTITLMGNTAAMIDRDGNKTPFGYSCVYNTRTKAAVANIQQ